MSLAPVELRRDRPVLTARLGRISCCDQSGRVHINWEAERVVRDSKRSAKKVLWQKMRRPELEEASKAKAIVIVATGSIEQHGPHLPVDTDINTVYEIAVRTATSIDEFPVLVAPPVWFGSSTHHMAFSGTISLEQDTFVRLIRDICVSIHAHGFEKILLLNGHGGNGALLTALTIQLGYQKIFVACTGWSGLVAGELRKVGESEIGGICHAGESETSVQLYLRPELVDMSGTVKAVKTPPTSFQSYDGRVPGRVWYPIHLRESSASGVAGDPTVASADKGRHLVEAAVRELSLFLHEFHEVEV